MRTSKVSVIFTMKQNFCEMFPQQPSNLFPQLEWQYQGLQLEIKICLFWCFNLRITATRKIKTLSILTLRSSPYRFLKSLLKWEKQKHKNSSHFIFHSLKRKLLKLNDWILSTWCLKCLVNLGGKDQQSPINFSTFTIFFIKKLIQKR